MIITYSNQIVQLDSGLHSAGHDISKPEMKQVQIKGFTKGLDITAESIMKVGISYNESVSRLLVWKTRLDAREAENENALVVQARKTTRKGHNCKRKGHLA